MRFPCKVKAPARFIAVVVLPVPPFCIAIASLYIIVRGSEVPLLSPNLVVLFDLLLLLWGFLASLSTDFGGFRFKNSIRLSKSC
jgi:hypothetical protein